MVKEPVAGRVKTRLVRDGVPADAAAAIAAAMHECMLARLARRGPVRLAVSPDSATATMGTPIAADVVGQGEGDLGVRIERVWPDEEAPVAVFGADTPDVPSSHIDAIGPLLAEHDAVIGPAADGGYWSLAACAVPRPLLRGIDWGTASVYDQTVRRALEGGWRVARAPEWRDVDDRADLDALLQRLDGVSSGEPDADLLAILRDAIHQAMSHS